MAAAMPPVRLARPAGTAAGAR